MNIAKIISVGTILLAAAFTATSQDFDDIYYNPSTAKAKAERKAKKDALKAQRQAVIISEAEASSYDYAPADLYSDAVGAGTAISVDEYNRRGIFAVADTSQITAESGENGDFTYTQRIQRFHNPEVVANDEEVALYIAQQPETTVNIIVNDPGYYGYWGSPWRYNSVWGYDPFWGPSWAWGYPSYWGWGYYPAWSWGPSWAWSWGWGGWGPSWSWGWGGWGPAWGGSWAWGGPAGPPAHGVAGRPGTYTYNPRRGGDVPSTGQRPGASAHRPTADGYRPGSGLYPTFDKNGNVSGAVRPGAGSSYNRPNSSQGYRPGTSVSTGTSNKNSSNSTYSRPGRGGNSNSSSYRSGNSSGSTRSGSTGGGGGSRSTGGGGGSRGGRH